MEGHRWEGQYPEGVTWSLDIEARLLQDLLDEAAEEVPDTVMCDFLDRRFTFGQFRQLSDRAAAGFQALGVGKGVHVGLFLPNVPQYIVALFGVLKAGGTVVNFSPLQAEQELIHQIEDSETRIMVTLNMAALYPKLAKAMERTAVEKVVVGNLAEVLPFPKNLLFGLLKRKDISPVPKDSRHMTYRDLLANDGAYEAPVLGDLTDEVAMLQYTGGTTGTPKGAMLTHACISATNEVYHEWNKQYDYDRPKDEKVLMVLPLFHIFGLSAVMLSCVRDHMQMILYPVPDIDRLMKDIPGKRPTTLPGVPTLFTAIANHPKAAETDFSSLRHCVSGGRAVARGGAGTVRAGHRHQALRRLRPHRNLARSDRPNPRRRIPGEFLRPPPARHRD